jgi:hypothetical protein
MSNEDESDAQERLVIRVIRSKVRKTQHDAQFATKLDGFLSFIPP